MLKVTFETQYEKRLLVFCFRSFNLCCHVLPCSALSMVGSVYIFERQSTDNWSQAAKLMPDWPSSDSYFGYTLSLSGDALVVSDMYNDDIGSDAGEE